MHTLTLFAFLVDALVLGAVEDFEIVAFAHATDPHFGDVLSDIALRSTHALSAFITRASDCSKRTWHVLRLRIRECDQG